MTNNELQAVAVNKNQFGSYEINFSLTATGTKIFLNYTTENVGSHLGIVLDKHVISAPTVNNPITGGSAQITGNFTKEAAENLATYLKMKEPLPIPLKVKQPLDNDGNQ
jgi:preprotein translocase subunit SecD